MAFGTITVTESTFGSISGTVVGAIPGTLSGSIGVPGPAGPTGPQGPAGQGVPAGGTAGQFLTKIDGTNYNTDWTTINLSAYVLKANNLSDLTNASTARNNLSLGPTNTPTFSGISGYSGGSNIGDTYKTYSVGTEVVGGVEAGFQFSSDTYVNDGSGGPIVGNTFQGSYGENGLSFRYRADGWTYRNLLEWDGSEEGKLVVSSADHTTGAPISSVSVGPESITFPNASVQTIAFPGFNNVALTGNSTAVTAALGDNDTSIATTAFVQQELLSGTANARNLEVQVRNQSGSTMAAGSIVYISGATGNLPLITKAQANNDANSAQTIGFVKTSIANNGTGYVIVRGVLENIDTSALTEGVQLYLSPSTAGTWTTTKPSAPQHLVYVGVVIRSHPTLGTILVAVQNGYELGETHDVALSSLANNDLLVYELSTDLWKNKSFATLGLAGLNSPTFTGTPSLPTGTTAVTQSPGDNTTALATTAFVQQEVPAASTTAAGKVELATNAEALTSTSTTLAVTPDDVPWAISNGNIQRLDFINNTAISGSGAVTTIYGGYRQFFLSTAGSAGRASFSAGIPGTVTVIPGFDDYRQINFSKKIWLCGKFACNLSGVGGDANNFFSVSLGGYTAATTGDMTAKGIGLKKVGGASSVVELVVHNGTSQSTVATTKTVATAEVVEWTIYSDGTGNVTLYINGSQAATSSAGPTGATANTAGIYREQVEQTASAATRLVVNCYGGQIIIER